MTQTDSPQSLPPLLVSDFDGTITRKDFFRLAVERLLPPDTPDHWNDYRAGRISHFEAMRRYYAGIRASEAEVDRIIEAMEPEPLLAEGVEQLRQAGWELVIVSNGCDWYIDRILESAGVKVPVLTSPSRFVEGQGLLMELPRESPYFDAAVGIAKAAVVREAVNSGRVVAFAGNGFTDVAPACLVEAELRFAREDLAEALQKEALAFRPFERWIEVVRALAARRQS